MQQEHGVTLTSFGHVDVQSVHVNEAMGHTGTVDLRKGGLHAPYGSGRLVSKMTRTYAMRGLLIL